MKERLLNVLKWLFIVMGVLFLFQLLIGFGLFLGIMGFVDDGFSFVNMDKKVKPMQKAIKYIEDYRLQNGKYPSNLENAKLNKNVKYEYEATKDSNCYVLKVKSKKENLVKQYQRCYFESDGGMSNTQSYTEYTD